MVLSDGDLLRLIGQRDAAAFELLFMRYRGAIQRHLVQMLRDEQTANDLVQEVFVRVWTHAEQWDGRGSARAWLFRIATNHAISYLRSPRHRSERSLDAQVVDAEDEFTIAALIESPLVGPEMIALFAERRVALHRLVERLPPEKQVVFRMIHDDMDIREVAETLGIPEGTVKSRLHYARRWLARAWNNLHREDEEEL